MLRERKNRCTNFLLRAEGQKNILRSFAFSRQAITNTPFRWSDSNGDRDVIRTGESFLAQEPSLSVHPATLNRDLLTEPWRKVSENLRGAVIAALLGINVINFHQADACRLVEAFDDCCVVPCLERHDHGSLEVV